MLVLFFANRSYFLFDIVIIIFFADFNDARLFSLVQCPVLGVFFFWVFFFNLQALTTMSYFLHLLSLSSLPPPPLSLSLSLSLSLCLSLSLSISLSLSLSVSLSVSLAVSLAVSLCVSLYLSLSLSLSLSLFLSISFSLPLSFSLILSLYL